MGGKGMKWAGAMLLAFGTLGLGACDGGSSGESLPPALPHAVMTPAPKTLALPTLKGSDGPLEWAKLKGRWVWVYLGYGNCPDVCPTALSHLAEEYRGLKQPERVQFVFVSVDPERDVPETLKRYTAFYHPAFWGATGDRQNIDAVAKAFGASYVIDKPATAGPNFNYPVSHTNLVFIIDPEGRYVAAYVPEATKGGMAGDFNALLSPNPAR